MGGRNNYPEMSNADALGFAEYLERVEQWADNLFGETYPTPGDLPAGAPDGRTAFVQSNKTLYVSTGGAFVAYAGAPLVANIVSFGAGYSFGPGTTSRVTRRGDIVYMNVQMVRNQDILVNNTAFILPVGFRPYADTYITSSITNGGSQGRIGFSVSASTGTVTVNSIDSPGGHPNAVWVRDTFEAA